MASELPISEQIQQLIRTSDSARGIIASDVRNLKYKLDVPSRFKDSLRSNPTGWIGGAMAAGLASSLLFRRKPKRKKETLKEEVKKTTVKGVIFTVLLTVLRPLVKAWLTGQVRNYLTAKFAGSEIPSRPRRSVTPSYK